MIMPSEVSSERSLLARTASRALIQLCKNPDILRRRVTFALRGRCRGLDGRVAGADAPFCGAFIGTVAWLSGFDMLIESPSSLIKAVVPFAPVVPLRSGVAR